MMIEESFQRAYSSVSFRLSKGMKRIYNRFNLPVVSTGRSFELYRKIFFDNRSEADVLAELRGRRIVDVGCGLTPYTSNSMFQACLKAGVEFYGVDPKLARGFSFDLLDRANIYFVGGGRMMPDAPGIEKALGTYADSLPFENSSVDLVLSSHALYAWIDDEQVLAKIFREFLRVLKPGGIVRIFPTPYYDLNDIRDPGLREAMEKFRVSQKFNTRLIGTRGIYPGYLRTYEKL